MSKWHVQALLVYILSLLVFIYPYGIFCYLERDKSKAHGQYRVVIHIYRILFLTKFSESLLL